MSNQYYFGRPSESGLPGKGPVPAKYMLIGMCPSTKRPRDRKLEPFGASSHAMIDRIVSSAPPLYITNLVKDPQPPGTKLSPAMVAKWIDVLRNEIEIVKPQRILTMSEDVAKALIPNFKRLWDDHGTFFRLNGSDAWIIPTYHFSAMMRNPKIRPMLFRDLERFFSLPDPVPAQFSLYDRADDINFLKGSKDPEIVLDLETGGLEYNTPITQIGLEYDGEIAIIKDPTKDDLIKIGNGLASRRARLIGHNLHFDLKHLLYHTDMKWPRMEIDDTMLMAHQRGEAVLGLKSLTTLYTDRPGSRFGGGWEDPLYLAEDLLSTGELWLDWHADFDGVYAYRLACDLTTEYAAMHVRGAFIDRDKLQLIRADALEYLERTEAILNSYEVINWNSPAQVGPVLVSHGVKPRSRTATGQLSVAEKELLPHADHPLVKALLDHRAAEKMLGFCDSYLELTSDDHPYLHTTIKLASTATGRTSSAEPNLQQVPRTGPLKSIFVSRHEGGKIGVLDLEQAELRVAALLSNDPVMAAALNSEDFHMFVASKALQKDPSEVTPAQRKASKTVTFGLLYGGSISGIAKKADLPEHMVETLFNMILHDQFKKLGKFIEKCHEDALESGELRTFFGRRRDLSEEDTGRTKRLSVNTPIQSVASDCMLTIIRGTANAIRDARLKSRILFSIHDSMLIDIYPGEQSKVAQCCQRGFETLWQSPLATIPLFKTLPLNGTLVVGPSWASVESTNEGYAPETQFDCSSAGPVKNTGKSPVINLGEVGDEPIIWDDDDL